MWACLSRILYMCSVRTIDQAGKLHRNSENDDSYHVFKIEFEKSDLNMNSVSHTINNKLVPASLNQKLNLPCGTVGILSL